MRRAACILLLVSAATAAAADLYRVSGVVMNARTHTPVPSAQVYFYKFGTPFPRAPFICPDGKFSFDVPDGSYILNAGTRTSIEAYGEGGNRDSGLSSGVIVGRDRDTSNVIFDWYPSAAISGRIVDEAGDPVESALVQLIRSFVTAGRRVTRTWRWARTNDRGEYRFGSIPGGGRYYLAVTGTPWYDAPASPLDKTPQPSLAFVPVFYPNTQSASQAAPIVVAPGEEARADFSLIPAAGARLAVTVTGAETLTGSVTLTRDGIEGVDSFQKSEAFTSFALLRGQVPHTMSGIAPGHYEATVAGMSTGASGNVVLSGHAAIDVNGLDGAVEVAMHPQTAIAGRVQLAPTMKPVSAMSVSLISDTGARLGASLKPDGSFAFRGVARGKYRIGVGGVVGFVAKVETDGLDFRDGLLTIEEGGAGKVTLTLSDETGNVSGVAMAGDKPAPAVLVLLSPAEESRNPAKYRGYQTESDGSFNYTAIPAGDYYVFALEDTGFEYANPDAIRPYLATAKKITIAPHQTLADQRIPITPAK